MTDERAYWLAWSQVPGIGPILLRRIYELFGSLVTAWAAAPAQLIAVEGIGTQLLEAILTSRAQLQPESLLQQHLVCNPDFWTPADPDYPRLLLEIANPPSLLYYRGKVLLEENQGSKPAIAIVGTRDPSDYGRRWTRKITTALVQNNFTIISGLAEGIDAEAHQSCLEAGGRTIAVLGTGVDVVYPAKNRILYDQVLQQGAALSEYPAGTQPDRTHFPSRNRIVAGLCRAVIVIEAPSKSGALITARLANDCGRDVYVLPGSLDNPRAIGCLELVNKGAQLILSEQHLLEMLGSLPTLDPVRQSARQPSLFDSQILPDLDPQLQEILQAVSQEAMPFDLIVQQTGLTTASVSSALLQLELLGVVTQLPGMRYQRAS